jgi:hypothetical protein
MKIRKAEVDRVSRLWFVLALRPFEAYDVDGDRESSWLKQLKGLLGGQTHRLVECARRHNKDFDAVWSP